MTYGTANSSYVHRTRSKPTALRPSIFTSQAPVTYSWVNAKDSLRILLAWTPVSGLALGGFEDSKVLFADDDMPAARHSAQRAKGAAYTLDREECMCWPARQRKMR